jgi:thiamine pyrophosphate-dependent acetolactate synthase large subunit-like protein
VDRWRRQRRAALTTSGPGLDPRRVVQVAREMTPTGTIASVEAGSRTPSAAACWDAVEPGELIVAGTSSTSGFALPAAIAAQLVHPERPVICVTDGDGLMRAASELETLAWHELPLAVVVLDDGRPILAAVPALARSVGIEPWVVDTEVELRAAFASALGATRPSLVVVRRV